MAKAITKETLIHISRKIALETTASQDDRVCAFFVGNFRSWKFEDSAAKAAKSGTQRAWRVYLLTLRIVSASHFHSCRDPRAHRKTSADGLTP